MQVAVNQRSDLLSKVVGAAIGTSPERIEWVSPLASDGYAEYRDQGFLDRLGLPLNEHPLKKFWPSGGPQWDALGRADGRAIVLEAKAQPNEMRYSKPCKASPASLNRIRASLDLVKASLGVPPEIDWTGRYYQYANRLAHLYLLRQLNQIPAELVHLCFLNDQEVNGPTAEAEWHRALDEVHAALGLTEAPLLRHVHHVFVDVTDLARFMAS